MASQQAEKYAYTLDQDDIIISVAPDWEQFARENDAPHLTAKNVVGTCLWDHVKGEDVVTLYRKLFERLRRDRGMTVIPYNCDSPAARRSFDLYVQALNGDVLALSSRIISREPRSYHSFLDRSVTRSQESYSICSICKNVQFPDRNWNSLEQALIRINLDQSIAPNLKEVVCPECEAVLEKA